VIDLSKINGKAIVVNCELIESIEGGPDTVVTLTTGSKIVVQDRPGEIVRKVIEYRRAVNLQDVSLHLHPAEAEHVEKVAEGPGSGERN
jgi:flagellar protein FlbD